MYKGWGGGVGMKERGCRLDREGKEEQSFKSWQGPGWGGKRDKTYFGENVGTLTF